MKKTIMAMCMSLAMGISTGCHRVDGHYRASTTADMEKQLPSAVSNVINDIERRGFVLSSLRIEYYDKKYYVIGEGLNVEMFTRRGY